MSAHRDSINVDFYFKKGTAMGISARLNGVEVIGPLTDDETWRQCKKLSKQDRDSLIMSASGYPCFPRTSYRGLRHFAHYPGSGAPDSSKESLTHIFVKILVAKVLLAAGWDVSLESPSADRSWIADVLSTSPQGRRVAWEVQVSPISEAEFSRRSAKYRQEGIYVVWLTPFTSRIPPNVDAVWLNLDRDHPLASISEASTVEAALYRNGYLSRPLHGLESVLIKVLTGQTAHSKPIHVTTLYGVHCWKCRELVTIWENGSWAMPSGLETQMTVDPHFRGVVERSDFSILQVVSGAVQAGGLPRMAELGRCGDIAWGIEQPFRCPFCHRRWRDCFRDQWLKDARAGRSERRWFLLTPTEANDVSTVWGIKPLPLPSLPLFHASEGIVLLDRQPSSIGE